MQRFLLAGCLMVAEIASADEPTARSCTSIADNTARLACYDAALKVSTLQSSSAASTASPEFAAATAPTREAAFGDTGNLPGSQNKKPVLPKRLTATVTRAVSLGQGLYKLTLDNGQIWQTTEADWAVNFDASVSVTISRMTFGNYLIARTGQGSTVAVKRVQ